MKSLLLQRFTTLLEERLIKDCGYSLVNRNDLTRLIEEQKMVFSGIVDDNVIKAGKICGADKALLGNILGIYARKTNDEYEVQVVIDVKYVDIETTAIINTFNIKEIAFESIKGASVDLAIEKAVETFILAFSGIEIKNGAKEKERFRLETKERLRLETLENEKKAKLKKFENRIYAGLNLGVASFKSDFSDNEGINYSISSKNDFMTGFEIEVGKSNVFISGGIFKNDFGTVNTLSAGFIPVLYKKNMFYVKAGGKIKGILSYGTMGHTTKQLRTDSDKWYTANSELNGTVVNFSLTPLLRAEYTIDNITFYSSLSYNISTSRDIKLTITDRISGFSEEIKLSGSTKVDNSGFEFNLGFSAGIF